MQRFPNTRRNQLTIQIQNHYPVTENKVNPRNNSQDYDEEAVRAESTDKDNQSLPTTISRKLRPPSSLNRQPTNRHLSSESNSDEEVINVHAGYVTVDHEGLIGRCEDSADDTEKTIDQYLQDLISTDNEQQDSTEDSTMELTNEEVVSREARIDPVIDINQDYSTEHESGTGKDVTGHAVTLTLVQPYTYASDHREDGDTIALQDDLGTWNKSQRTCHEQLYDRHEESSVPEAIPELYGDSEQEDPTEEVTDHKELCSKHEDKEQTYPTEESTEEDEQPFFIQDNVHHDATRDHTEEVPNVQDVFHLTRGGLRVGRKDTLGVG